MNTVGNVSNTASVTYAMQIAQTSSLKRSLNNLSQAIQTGNLSSAGNILSSLVKANPQFAATPGSATQPQDPINQGFQAISEAIEKNDVQGAQAAWDQLKIDLDKSGITINDGTADTAKLLADNKASINETILANTFGTNSNSLVSLIGGNNSSSGTSKDLETVVRDWLTYKAGGKTESTPTGSTLNVLG